MQTISDKKCKHHAAENGKKERIQRVTLQKRAEYIDLLFSPFHRTIPSNTTRDLPNVLARNR